MGTYEEVLNNKRRKTDKNKQKNDERLKRSYTGYTPKDVIRALEYFKCKGRLLDIRQTQFLGTDKNVKIDQQKIRKFGALNVAAKISV